MGRGIFFDSSISDLLAMYFEITFFDYPMYFLKFSEDATDHNGKCYWIVNCLAHFEIAISEKPMESRILV